jgi:hypothetical protein
MDIVKLGQRRGADVARAWCRCIRSCGKYVVKAWQGYFKAVAIKWCKCDKGNSETVAKIWFRIGKVVLNLMAEANGATTEEWGAVLEEMCTLLRSVHVDVALLARRGGRSANEFR